MGGLDSQADGAGGEKGFFRSMPAMPGVTSSTDARVAALLAQAPEFADWRVAPLDTELANLLNRADRQTLMTLAAEALRRVMEAGRPRRERA